MPKIRSQVRVPGLFVENCTLRFRHGLLKVEQKHALAREMPSRAAVAASAA